jgi:Na+/H+ antiporter NhaD/arsenite permease-like protein
VLRSGEASCRQQRDIWQPQSLEATNDCGRDRRHHGGAAGSCAMSGIATMAWIILAAVLLFVWNRLPVVIVAMGVAVALYATGLLTIGEAFAGLGDPAVVFIASLFIVSAGLEMTGVTAWAGQQLIAHAGRESRTRLLVFTMLLVALLTALISVNGAVAALLPVVVVMAVRLKRPPSQLLMPLVFSAHAGSMLALTGTPVNVLVSNAASSSSRSWACRCFWARWRSSFSSARNCCRKAAAVPCLPISAGMPGRWLSNIA